MMNGVKYFVMRCGKTLAEMAALTGLPEKQITAMMEEQRYAKPCHFYMRVAAVLGVPVERLIKRYPDGEVTYKGGAGVNWEEWFERQPDTLCRIYLAKINGPHLEYRFEREFLHVDYQYTKDNIHCYAGDLTDGVYEVFARWYDVVTGELVRNRRRWFAVFEGAPYELDEQDVLHTLFNIEAQNGRKAA